MAYSVDDIVSVKGRVTEVVENADGKFVRIRVKTTSGAHELVFEEDDIDNGVTPSNPTP